ncbi:MAG: O-antigen ligase [Clostridia bacterium]|nr:O-antigen ligase [Clostridia bacterium]
MKKLFLKMQENFLLKKTIYINICIFLCLYVFSLPSFSGRAYFQYISYILMAIYIALTFSYIFLYSHFEFKWPLLIIPIFVLWALIGTIIYSHEFRSWLTLFLLTITFITFYYSFIAIHNIRLVLKLLVLAFAIFSIYFIIHYYEDIFSKDLLSGSLDRLGDFYDNVNTIGSYMSFGCALCLYFVLFPKKKIEIMYVVPLIIFILIGFFTGSRAFVVIFLFLILFYLFIKFKNHKSIFFICLAGLIITFLILINLPFMSTIKNRFLVIIQTLTESGTTSDESFVTRFLWQVYGFELAAKQQIFGFGVNGFSIVSGIGTYTHGNLSEVMCNFGVIGFLFFYFAIIYPIFKLKEKNKTISFVVYAFLCMFILESFLIVFYADKTTYLIFGIIYYIFLKEDNCYSTVNIEQREMNDLYELEV